MRTSKRRNFKQNKRLRIACILSLVLIIGTIILALVLSFSVKKKPDMKEASKSLSEDLKGRVKDRLLSINEYSRPGIALKKVNGVVIHYTANPGTDAVANRNYFNNLSKINAKQKTSSYSSSNFIIGLDGTIIRCVPETEVAYASNDRNYDTLSIECCHPDATGKFTDATYDSLVWLVSTICNRYKIKSKDVIRHYDVTGKNCPKYFVENIETWNKFREDIILN